MGEAEWDEVMTVNLKAPYLLSLALGRAMRARGSGKIVNLADIAAERPYLDYLPYSVSKAGIVALTRGLARALAPQVQVNCVAPGPVLEAIDATPAMTAAVLRRTPLGRFGAATDVAAAVRFLIEGQRLRDRHDGRRRRGPCARLIGRPAATALGRAADVRYLVGRLAWAVVILLGTTWITFAIVFVVPGDPARVVAGPRADAETLATIRRELGLDRSLPVQYGHYVWRLAHGDLGRSYANRQPVAATLVRRLPATATLACAGLLIAIVIGLVGALVTAPLAGTWIDRLALVGSLALLSAPVFWLGMMGLYYVGFRWRLVPLGGAGSVRHLVLPALVLGAGSGVYYAGSSTPICRRCWRSTISAPPVLAGSGRSACSRCTRCATPRCRS